MPNFEPLMWAFFKSLVPLALFVVAVLVITHIRTQWNKVGS